MALDLIYPFVVRSYLFACLSSTPLKISICAYNLYYVNCSSLIPFFHSFVNSKIIFFYAYALPISPMMTTVQAYLLLCLPLLPLLTKATNATEKEPVNYFNQSILFGVKNCTAGDRALATVRYFTCQDAGLDMYRRRGGGYQLFDFIAAKEGLGLKSQLRRDDKKKTCKLVRYLLLACSLHYDSCFTPAEKNKIMRMWVKQLSHEVRLYDNKQNLTHTGVEMVVQNLLECKEVKSLIGSGNIAVIKSMSPATARDWFYQPVSAYWDWKLSYRQGRQNLLNGADDSNLKQLLRSDGKCDPRGYLQSNFSFDEKWQSLPIHLTYPPSISAPGYGLNHDMNVSYYQYLGCLRDVGMDDGRRLEPGARKFSMKENISMSNWHNREEVKWRTCASFTTFSNNCTAALLRCLSIETAQFVLGRDLYTLTIDFMDGKYGNEEMYWDYQYTDCDVFGGNISGVEERRIGSFLTIGIISCFLVIKMDLLIFF